MIHPGDVLHHRDLGECYAVTRVGERDVQCVNREGGPAKYMYPQINEVTLEIVDDAWSLVTCPHIAPSPQPTADLDPHGLTYWYNEGVLMGLVEKLYHDLGQALSFYDADASVNLPYYVEECRQSIMRAAGLLKPHPHLDGTYRLDPFAAKLTSTDSQPNTPKEN